MKPFDKVTIIKARAVFELMTYDIVFNALTLLGNKGGYCSISPKFSKPRYDITKDIINDFLLCIFVFHFSEIKINTANIKNSPPIKPTSFHRPSTYAFSKLGNGAIGNVSFKYTE